jgi:hypothetical protein
MTSFTNNGAFDELWYTLKAIKLATGVTPRCWRVRVFFGLLIVCSSGWEEGDEQRRMLRGRGMVGRTRRCVAG